MREASRSFGQALSLRGSTAGSAATAAETAAELASPAMRDPARTREVCIVAGVNVSFVKRWLCLWLLAGCIVSCYW